MDKPTHQPDHYAYTVTIQNRMDQNTLQWMADRGYDGSFLEHATLIHAPEDGEDGPWVYGLSEPEAWEVKEYIDSDPNAFLTCCGSSTLIQALLGLEDSIV